MAFDFKKEYKEFYLPKNKPQIVTVPPQITSPSGARVIQTRKAALTKQRLGYCMRLPTPSK